MGELKKIFTGIALTCILLLFVVGCGNSLEVNNTQKSMIITDCIGRVVELPTPITRVAVGNRYNMEVIKAIGATDKVVGVDYGIYQDQQAYGEFFRENQVIGKSQSALNYEKLVELNPQVLIIPDNGSWEDAERKLNPFGIKVVVMNAYFAEQFKETYTLAGKIFAQEERAQEFISFFQDKIDYIQKQLANVSKKKVYYEYKKTGTTTVPGDYFYMMVENAHVDNIFKNAHGVDIDIEAVVEKNPEAIVKVGAAGIAPKYLPPTVEEFEERKQDLVTRPGWEQLDAVKNNQILLLSQYVHGAAAKHLGTMYIAKYLYPEYLPDLHPEQVFQEWVTKYQGLPYVEGHTYPRFTLED